MKNIILSLTLVLSLHVIGQGYHDDYNWKDEPGTYVQPDSLEESGEVIFFKKIIQDCYFTETSYAQDKTYHEIIGVYTDAAVEANNKFYLSSGIFDQVEFQKARVINPDGTILELDEDDIEEGEDEESGNKVSYFALEGLEVGSVIEYIHRKSSGGEDYGRVFVQEESPILEFEYILTYPSILRFATLPVMMDVEPQERELSDEFHGLQWKIDDVPAYKGEDVAFYNSNRMQFFYKLDEVLSTGRSNLYNYNELGYDIFNNVMGEQEKKDAKCIKSFYKEIDIDDDADTEAKVRAIENHMKDNITILPFAGIFDLGICSCIETKLGGSTSGLKVFLGLLDKAEIKYELVLTSSREEMIFSEEFETLSMLDRSMGYFPELDMYTAPDRPDSKLGVVPSEWTDNYGLFIKRMNIAGTTSAVSEVRFIEATPMENNWDAMDIKVDFDLDEGMVTANYDKTLTGLYASTWQPFFPSASADRKEELEEAMINWISEDLEIIDSEIENIESDDFGVNPLKHNFTVKSTDFIEEAGNRVLFKVGQLIGPQSEMYEEEEERVYPVDAAYNHGYARTITFDIPEGYEVKNLDDLKINFTYDRDGETILAFVSDYTLEGNTVKIVIDEYYKENHFPVEEYEAFRSTINGAADFNKVTLVMVEK